MRSPAVAVHVDLDRIRANAEAIRARTRVPLMAVIKSDAYGLGAPPVADALAGVADEFAYFSLAEARAVGRPGLTLGPPDGEPSEYRALRVRPAIGTLEQARRYAGLGALVELDTGMQRFGCPADALGELLQAAETAEAFAHATTAAHAARLAEVCAALGGRVTRRHAASTSLLDEPAAWLDGVRPGMALYRGALRVTARLETARDVRGPVGYTGFECPRVGVLLVGYAQQWRPTAVLINGQRQRVLEVGMNTCFVSLAPADRAGDPVVLLGDGLGEDEQAAALGVRPQEVLCRFAGLGPRSYVGRRAGLSSTGSDTSRSSV